MTLNIKTFKKTPFIALCFNFILSFEEIFIVGSTSKNFNITFFLRFDGLLYKTSSGIVVFCILL